MKKHIVCLGDSNTYGYCADPADCADGGDRFNEDERWTCLLQKALGEGCLVLEEGLGGRTTVFPDPLTESLDAIGYIWPCLMSHAPVSLLIIMLGTNDTKDRFNVTPACIAQGMERLVRKAMTADCWAGGKPNILIVSPPPILPEMVDAPVAPIIGQDCPEKSARLAGCYEASARLLGVHFMDAAGCEFNHVDYMHLTRKGHAQLAEKFAAVVPGLI